MLDHVRTALFLPASNARAIAKAQTLPCDLVILDLEDAVPEADKDAARAAAGAAADMDWGDRLLAVRVNGPGSSHDADMAALAGLAGIDLIVVPKVETPEYAASLGQRLAKPVLAMIETPAGIYAAREIAGVAAVVGLLAGTNDLAATLRLPPDAGRAALMLALQSIVLAARAADIAPLDGVFNLLDDSTALEADCHAGRALGFSGKALIHPNQIEVANRMFAPSPAEIQAARELIAAATGGAERFQGRMIEAMHVDAARRLLGPGRRD
ncbi:HpcH/HpaI aldolase/citrate lyase family protein [Sphingomonas sp. ASY06-1R]|jgi:citrate lyase subunit beta/citryl-CoA lyase|uniref:HpcH/HpaI aldolase/citrate lyase family protein n=1 Tax=Sphingomonas sp. ASY06-1R TaxID=3445771 RepID=UPI003FA30FD1